MNDKEKKKKKKRKRQDDDDVIPSKKAIPVTVVPPKPPVSVPVQMVSVPQETQAKGETQTKKKKAKVQKNILWDFKSKTKTTAKPKHGRQWDGNRPKSLKQGTFSTEEKKIVMNAIKNYAKENGITDLTDLVSQDRTKRGAWSTIAMSLPHRSVRSIYNHGQRVLHKGRRTGRWSPDEVKRMHELYAKHGKKWKLIGNLMNRDPNHIRNKHTKLLEESCNKAWSDVEDKMLTDLVKVRSSSVFDR